MTHSSYEVPRDFKMPTSEAYDDVIADLDTDIKAVGGVGAFLQEIREDRRYWQSMHDSVYCPLTNLAYRRLSLDGRPSEQSLPFAKASVGGGVIAHIANEGLYPRLDIVKPYTISSIVPQLLGEAKDAYNKAEAERDTYMMFRIGDEAMAGIFLHDLSERSLKTLNVWGQEFAGANRRLDLTDRSDTFVLGFGQSMYLAWVEYAQRLKNQGREDYDSFPSIKQALKVPSTNK